MKATIGMIEKIDTYGTSLRRPDAASLANVEAFE